MKQKTRDEQLELVARNIEGWDRDDVSALWHGGVIFIKHKHLGENEPVFNREEVEAKRREITGEPDDKDAPEWAKFKCQDSDGLWKRFALMPFDFTPDEYSNGGVWGSTSGKVAEASRGEVIGDWRDTLKPVVRETKKQETRDELLSALARNIEDMKTTDNSRFATADVLFRGSEMYLSCCGSEFSIKEIYDRQQKLRNEPSDALAPDWAKWKGQCANGIWEWYRDKAAPNTEKGFFEAGNGVAATIDGKYFKGEVIGDWRDTLKPVIREAKAQAQEEVSQDNRTAIPEKLLNAIQESVDKTRNMQGNGLESSYYLVTMPISSVSINPDTLEVSFMIEEYIEHGLNNDFDRGNIAKANHRIGRKGNKTKYETNKIRHSAGRIDLKNK